ncbi:hypothetical protein CsSME_00044370 [Camellia sinensis var. sinensis]
MEPPENTAGAIESAEKIILRWDSTALEEARERMIFDSDRQEIDRYLQAVDEIQRSMESVTVTDDQNKVNGAMQIAMARLEDEFRNILISHTGPVEAESLVESVRSTPRTDSTGVDFPEEDYSFADSVVSKEVEVEFHVGESSSRSSSSSKYQSTTSIREIDLIPSEATIGDCCCYWWCCSAVKRGRLKDFQVPRFS